MTPTLTWPATLYLIKAPCLKCIYILGIGECQPNINKSIFFFIFSPGAFLRIHPTSTTLSKLVTKCSFPLLASRDALVSWLPVYLLHGAICLISPSAGLSPIYPEPDYHSCAFPTVLLPAGRVTSLCALS